MQRNRVRAAWRAALASLALAAPVFAQSPAPLLLPDLDVWTNGFVNDMQRDAGGGLIVAGTFDRIKGVPRRNLARLLPDGSVDPAFAPEPNTGVADIAMDDDGTLYVAGSFTDIGGQPRARLARLSSAGVVDMIWVPGLNSAADKLALGDDEIYVVGVFTHVNGQPRPRLAKIALAGNGALDTAWAPTANSFIQFIGYDAADDSLFLAGDFTSINGAPRARLAKIDASGTGVLRGWDALANAPIEAMELDGAGSLYVAGFFDTIGANGASRRGVARLSTATADADALSLDFLPGADGTVFSMDVAGDALYLAGSFTQVNAAMRGFAAKVSTLNGTLDTLFLPSLDQPAFEVFAPGDGKVYFANGATSYVNGDTRVGVAPVDAGTGATAAPLDVLRPGQVFALLALPGGGTIMAGDFYFLDDAPRENLAKLRADGSLDPDWTPRVDYFARSLALDAADGMVYVGGRFDRADGVPRNALAKFALDGSGALQAWDAGIVDTAGFEPVRTVAVQDDGGVIVGGLFAQIDGQSRANLARLSGDDATLDTGWGVGANDAVSTLAIGPDGSVYASGFFTAINGGNRDGLAKLDPVTGAVDLAFNANLVSGQTVRSFGFADDAMYLGGNFTSVGSTARDYAARIDSASGAVDTAWAVSAGSPVVSVLPAGPQVFLAGNFQEINGTPRARLAKVSAADGTLDAAWDPQAAGTLETAVLDPVGNLLIGGRLVSVGIHTRLGLAAVPPALPHVFGDGFED